MSEQQPPIFEDEYKIPHDSKRILFQPGHADHLEQFVPQVKDNKFFPSIRKIFLPEAVRNAKKEGIASVEQMVASNLPTRDLYQLTEDELWDLASKSSDNLYHVMHVMANELKNSINFSTVFYVPSKLIEQGRYDQEERIKQGLKEGRDKQEKITDYLLILQNFILRVEAELNKVSKENPSQLIKLQQINKKYDELKEALVIVREASKSTGSNLLALQDNFKKFLENKPQT